MSLSKVKKIKSDNQPLNQFQDSVVASLNPVLNCPLLNGNLISGITFSNTKDNKINHGLGRNFIGYFITRVYNTTGFPFIFESSTVNNSPEKFVLLNCLDSMTVDLWIF